MVTMADNARDAATPLIDRDDERAVLRDVCARADAGDGQLVLIGGEAGIGKTTLALATASLAPHGARALIGRSYDLMETPPYGPWRDAFRRWPEGPGIPPVPFQGTGDEPTTREALFARVQSALAALARAKLLILTLDDIQWADPASLDLLRHVAHNLAGRRMLMLCTYRSDELTAAHALTALLPRLLREAPTTRLILPRFPPQRVTEMVAAQFGAGQHVHALSRSVYRTTDGNPLFVREMCRALVSARAVRRTADGWAVVSTTLPTPPETLQELVAARIARLEPATRHVLEMAAVIGQTFTFPLLCQALSQPDEAILVALERAAAANIIGEDDPEREQYRFTHPIIHEALYHAVLVTRRRQWHRTIGEAIEGAPTDEAAYDRLAHHFGQAHDGARAVRYLMLAGDAAMRVFARATAIEYYEQALALRGPDTSEARDQLLLKLSAALAFADPVRRERYAEEALAGFIARGDTFNAGQVRWRLASAHWRFGRYARAEEQCRLAIQALTDAADEDAAVRAAPLLITILRDQGRYREAVAEGNALLAIAARGADRSARDAYYDLQHFIGYAYAALGDVERGYALMQRGMEGQRALDNPYIVSNFLMYLFFVVGLPYYADRADLLTDLVRQHGEAAERGRAQVGSSLAAGWYLEPYWAFLHGDWAHARQDLVTLPDPPPASILARAGWAVCAAQLALAEGRAADGIGLIQRQLPPPGAEWTLPHHLHVRLMHLLALLSLAEGQYPAAKQALDEGAALLVRGIYVPAVAEHHLAWAAYYRMRGHLQRAQTSATTAAEQATTHHDLLALATARRVLGELAMERGAWAVAESELARAEEIAARIPATHERAAVALARATLAITRTDKPDRAAAQQALETAEAIIAPLGATPLQMQLDALRARLHAVNPAQAYGITAREADVLRHLVAGASNQEIADHLSISRRTVDQHVSNILAKLGVTNRVAATSLALERGLIENN